MFQIFAWWRGGVLPGSTEDTEHMSSTHFLSAI